MTQEKVCPKCGARYGAGHAFCFVDGAALILVSGSQDLVGSVIAERYKIVSKLGAGGMGEVYLAEHVRIRRKSAVKVMRKGTIDDPIAIMRFNREAENASQISHPNVAAVYDFGETHDGLVYLAMEFVDGEPLSKIMHREGSIIPVRVADIVRQSADALSVAHVLGILHRDLKPDNIMIAKTRAGTDLVKIVDFGIARAMQSETQHVTSTGIAVGTPEYMSPEQFTGEKLDPRSDLYALALVAFHLLTGAPAFPPPTSKEALLARFIQRPRTLVQARPDVPWPDELQGVFDKALASDPDGRHADVMDFAIDFDAAVARMVHTTMAQEYLDALSNRRLTPSRSFTPAEGSMARVETPSGPVPASRETPARATTPTPAEPRSATREIAPRPVAPPANEPPRAPITAPPSLPDESADASDGELVGVTSGPEEEPWTPDTATALIPDVQPLLSGEIATRPRPSRRAVWAAGSVVVLLAIGGLTWFAARGSLARPTTLDSVAAVQPLAAPADSGAVTVLPPVTEAPIAAVAAAAVSIDSVAQRLRSGVFGVSSTGTRGAGFLIDSGIVATSSRFVPLDGPIEVQVSPTAKVVGRVAALDSAQGIALLAISRSACPRCPVLRLATSDSAAAVGDTVAALATFAAAPADRVRRVAMTTTGSAGVGVSIPLPRAGEGGPIIARDSSVIALAAAPRGGKPRFVSAPAVSQLLARARAAVAGGQLAVNDSVFPIWPTTPYAKRPVDQIRAAPDSAKLGGLAKYRVGSPSSAASTAAFSVFVMPPRIAAWRDQSARNDRAKNAISSIRQQPPSYDPLSAWTGWQPILDSLRAVVTVVIGPADAAFPYPDWQDTRALTGGDFRRARLLRDNREVLPLAAATTPSVVNAAARLQGGGRQRQRIPNLGVLVFLPEAFLPERGSPRSPDVVLEISPVDDRVSPVRIALPPSMLQAIAAEFRIR